MPPLSHLTSCTQTKPNLYIVNFLSAAAAVSEPTLYKPLTFQAPNLTPFFRCLGRTKVSDQVRGFLCEHFVTRHVFYGEKLLAPCPTPKLEDHTLSAVLDCLFNMFAATLHNGGRSSIRNLRMRRAVLTGAHLSCPKFRVHIE